jgi:hypothetical protein
VALFHKFPVSCLCPASGKRDTLEACFKVVALVLSKTFLFLLISMVSKKQLERSAANEPVDLLFYKIIEKDGKRMLKPLKSESNVPLKLVRAIADNTIVSSFYATLARNLMERGVKEGTKVQLRAKFSPNHELIDPVLKGTIVLCEVDI